MVTLTVVLILTHVNNKTLISKRIVCSPLTLVISFMWQHYGNITTYGDAYGNTNTVALVITLTFMMTLLVTLTFTVMLEVKPACMVMLMVTQTRQHLW